MLYIFRYKDKIKEMNFRRFGILKYFRRDFVIATERNPMFINQYK